jgi:hypothetical protein
LDDPKSGFVGHSPCIPEREWRFTMGASRIGIISNIWSFSTIDGINGSQIPIGVADLEKEIVGIRFARSFRLWMIGQQG